MKVSIIVPVYNSEKYLKRCIDSILNQTFDDFECILVDDGSTDKSGKICDDYDRKYESIKVVHIKNSGQGAARNVGIDIAKGQYIGFIDSDDWIHPQMYEILYNVAAKYNFDFVTCDFEVVNTEMIDCTQYRDNSIFNTVQGIESKDVLLNFEKMYWKIRPNVCCKLYKKEVFAELRFSSKFFYEDLLIFIPSVLESRTIGKIQIPLYYYFNNVESSTKKGFYNKKTDRLEVYLQNIELLKNAGYYKSMYFQITEFVYTVIDLYFFVNKWYPGSKEALEKYISIYKKNFKQYVLKNDRLCKMYKFMCIIFLINKEISANIYYKYFSRDIQWDKI